MKATPWAALAILVAAALCAFWPAPSSAQDRSNIYAVAGIRVDVPVSSAAAAQSEGFAAAQRQGFERLFRRLTPATEQARGVPTLDGSQLERLAISVDVEEERRSGTRYIARLTVRYDGDGVRAALRNAGYTVIEARAAPVLIAPVLGPQASPELLPVWRAAWAEGGFGQELVPLAIAPAMLNAGGDWNAVEQFARAEAAGAAVYAALRVQGSTATAALTQVGPNGVRVDRGEVTARLAGEDAGSLRTALGSLAEQASAVIQNDWKARAGASSGPTERARVSASALYGNQRQWERIKAGLEAAAQTLISEIRIEAVGREGALVSFSYTGGAAQLGEELNRRGISLQDSPNGPILRATGR